MEFSVDIQLIIKEYSMPIYRKCLHYKAYINAPDYCVLKYNLKTTPYKLGDVKYEDLLGTRYSVVCYRI